MARHTFSFDESGKLTSMGATWFVSYLYHNEIDESHVHWRTVSTWKNRASVFDSTGKYHKFWLEQVLNMSDDKLGTNDIGLSGNNVKRMAQELLARMERK